MTNSTYDKMKMAALLAAPVIVFLSAILSIWNVAHAAEITATLAALQALLGAAVKTLSDRHMKEADNA